MSLTGYDRQWRQRLEEHADSRVTGAGDRLGAIERHEAPVGQDAQPCGKREGFTHVVSHHHNRLADPFLNAMELPVDFGPSERIERTERLVHQDHRRVGGKRPCESNTLALSS